MAAAMASKGDSSLVSEKTRYRSESVYGTCRIIGGDGLTDNTSVIGDAIKHVKELQERLRVLEEENKNSHIESVVTLNKLLLIYKSWSDDGSKAASANNESLPHVDAKILDKNVLIRIQCQKQKSYLLNKLVEIQKLHLFVVNSSVLAIGDSILDITIIARAHI
ncbi:transcription factor bHLH25 [Medicago truncatula]|uniref:transcription factor bHLH25 n=1 Tax=Medicago truncatula TaxID=3880 RepID=UPI0019671B91|nr:transcription factor bHLH25 [Medicago truncatula]